MRTAVLLTLAAATVFGVACEAKSPPKGTTAATDSADKVKSLLRGEMAAVSTYEDAMKKNDAHAWTPELKRILGEHRDAVDLLKARVQDLGVTPDFTAGAWGGWTELVAKAAAVLGDEPARDALKTGEKMGAKAYEDALVDGKVDEATKSLIRDRLLARTREHVTALEKLTK